MPYYCVQTRATAGPMQTYWILADSAEAARALVALNVPGAVHARDMMIFDCLQDDAKTPPVGLIYRDTGGPFTITILE
jgi:hypothetical protein